MAILLSSKRKKIPHGEHTGKQLKTFYQGGPDNPLGEYAMRLNNREYLIHGTNDGRYVGMRVSHGCIRLHASSIKELFGLVDVKTPVRIINQPIRVGVENGRLFIEVSTPLVEDAIDDEYLLLMARMMLTQYDIAVDGHKLLREIKRKRDFPIDITKNN